jgi:uncharacterized protein (TIGR03435 family)
MGIEIHLPFASQRLLPERNLIRIPRYEIEMTSEIGRALGGFCQALRRPVINRTGLTGGYVVHLRWSLDSGTAAREITQDNPSLALVDKTGPSVFTALPEQLGLRLESGKGPVQVVVVDHVEEPSEN